MMDPALAQALWHGPPADPQAPGRALAEDMEQGLEYAPLLTRLRQLVRHGLPVEPALSRALDAHPASIDLALIAVQAGDAAALDSLAQRVGVQNRRRAALGWALWSRGFCDRAQASLADLDPTSDTFDGDRAARAELAILSGADPGPLDGPRAAHLGALQTYRRDGAAALLRRIMAQAPPPDPALWVWLIDTFSAERDFASARHALDRLAAHHGDTHATVRAQRIRLALDSEDTATARHLLDAEGATDTPWTWSARRLAQHLRCRISEHAEGLVTSDALRQTADAIGRLEPGHGFVTHLRLSVDMATQPWDALERRFLDPASEPLQAAQALARIGLPESALIALDRAPPGTPDTRAAMRLRRAELHLMMGDPAAALTALGPVPRDHAHKPGDAYWRAEITLARRDPQGASAILRPALDTAPTQMGLLLNLARAQFLMADFDAAQHTLDLFRAFKTVQLGTPPEDDLRDRITADAARARTEERCDEAAPGLAAYALALAPPPFRAASDARIPRRLAHYWEGPIPDPVQRGLRAWARLHPGFEQRRFDAATAAIWIARHAPDLSDLFACQRHPAIRADLFRLAWIVHSGGIFTDLDEYPRAPVTPWLTDARAVLVIEQGYGTIANNFLAAEPGVPLFHRALAAVAQALNTADAPYPWWHSGPAQLTAPALAASRDPAQSAGLRFLTQPHYNAVVSTNLPFPHKRSADHWR